MIHPRTTLLAVAFAVTLPIAAFAQGTTKSAAKSPPATQAQLQKEAKIKYVDASATALKEVPGGKVSKHKLDQKKGKVVYAFTIKVAGKAGSDKVDVDATTGEMVSHTHSAPIGRAATAKKPSSGS